LLDWTKTPQAAASFAALDALVQGIHNNSSKRLAVWAANLDEVWRQTSILSAYTCPRSENHYLNAQDAVFLWYPGADRWYMQTGRWPALDEVIGKNHPPLSRINPAFVKITLPANEARTLLARCHLERWSQGNLMPDYSGVVRAVLAEWRFGFPI